MRPRFQPFDFFLLRTPRLPSHNIHKLNTCSSKEEMWHYLVEVLRPPHILDAIYVASKDFFDELFSALNKEYNPSNKKLLITAYKYMSRMAGRATPYGKFSGIALGEISRLPSAMNLTGNFLYTYRMEMEMDSYLRNFVSNEPSIYEQLVYFTNTTLRETSDSYRYIEYTDSQSNRDCFWSQIAKTPLLTYVLSFTKKGKPFKELINLLAQFGIVDYRGRIYLRQLIEAKVLISEMHPTVMATDSPILPKRLRRLSNNLPWARAFESFESCLKDINYNQQKLYTHTDDIRNLMNYTNKNMLQVDMRIDTTLNRINKGIVDNLVRELEELAPLNRAAPPQDLKSFCKEFTSRYGDREIPLLEAIDQESGVGYGTVKNGGFESTPLLNGLGSYQNDLDKTALENEILYFLDHVYLNATPTLSTFELDNKVIERFYKETSIKPDNLPASFYILGNLVKLKDTRIDEKSFRFNLLAAGGVSAIPLMTRFCHLDGDLEDKLKTCVTWEENQNPEAIFAEIIYLPDNRAGNILKRPSLFKYEIPIIGQSNVTADFRILLDDLLVSVKQDKVILRSSRLNKQVIPRLSSAHNYHYGMVIYRFLCDLQYQSGTLNISWDWGMLSHRAFLPRVTYKHIILARARWNISKDLLGHLNDTDNQTLILSLQDKFKLPDIVVLAEGDNELIIDLRNPVGVEIILKQLMKGSVILYEYLFHDFNSPVRGNHDEIFNNELIIPFKVEKPIGKIKFKPFSENTIKRSFLPGSEWAFVKIYCSEIEGERILRNQIAALINELRRTGLIKKWFFIRYYDPAPHLRLRFLLHEKDDKLPFQELTEFINRHFARQLEKQTIYRITYDTYERELERYGGNSIAISETIFQADSDAVISLLTLLCQNTEQNLRWLAAIRGVDDLLSAFGMDITEKIALVTSLRDAFLDEFSGYSKLSYKLDMKYRENRDRLKKFLNTNDNHVHSVLGKRFQTLKPLAMKVSRLVNNNTTRLNIISSLSHMFNNRIFFSNQRKQEMIIYHFLAKHYIATLKSKKEDYLDTSIETVSYSDFNP